MEIQEIGLVHRTVEASVEEPRAYGVLKRRPIEESVAWKDVIARIQSCKFTDAEFFFLCFHRWRTLALTELQVVVERPSFVAEDYFYAQEEKRLQAPFHWMLRNLNMERLGKPPGMLPFLDWTLDSLLETGIAGWEFIYGPVDIHGNLLLLPTEGIVYSGHAMNNQDYTWNSEEWEVVQVDGTKMRFLGEKEPYHYRDVIKTLWRPGMREPRPPHTPLLRDLRIREELQARDLITLAKMGEDIEIWEIDLGRVREFNIPYEDVKDEEGNVVKKGIRRLLQEALESMADRRGMKRFIVPDVFRQRREEVDTRTLLASEKYNESRRRLYQSAGILFDETGRLLEEESLRTMEGQLFYLRDLILEPHLYRLCVDIVRQNPYYFKVYPEGYHEARAELAEVEKGLRSRKPGTNYAELKRRKEELHRMIEDLEAKAQVASIHLQFAPLAINPDTVRRIVFEGQRLGSISTQTLHEVLGLPHEVERDRLLREKKHDLIERPPVDLMSIYEAPTTYKQVAQTTGTKEVGMPKPTGEQEEA